MNRSGSNAHGEEIETKCDENGYLPDGIYRTNISSFAICPPQSSEVAEAEAKVWNEYLSATRKEDKNRLMYDELYRYEFYEGRKRQGFWGNIEDAIKKMNFDDDPRVTILSAGTGRDLLKVGLAAGIWKSTASRKIRGTYKEISPEYLRLVKPKARVMVTEYEEHVLGALRNTVDQLINKALLNEEMVTVRKWDFRYRTPLATGSQDLVVFALAGNYAKLEEQPLILRELARVVKVGSYLVASTMLPELNFSKAIGLIRKIRIILSSPLFWPVLREFVPWQVKWGKMAGSMNEAGIWCNVPATTWMQFLQSAGMEKIEIYPSPSSLLPVEVLVARKEQEAKQ
jgi:SAM-dependent methyltransferase